MSLPTRSVFGPERPRPTIVILALDDMTFYEDTQAAFLTRLHTHADVEKTSTPDAVRAALQRRPAPAVVLAVDASLTASTRRTLVLDVLSYVRRGGVLLFAGLFASFAPPPDVDALFAALGLPWAAGEYHRTTFQLNPSTHGLLATGGLPQRYSQKALHLAHVAPHDALYLPAEDAEIEVFGQRSGPIGDRTQTPAAFAELGEGRVGYLGDVNSEEETKLVALAMCGFLS
nr:hypothetical protein CFP56_71702 [Quercus suber]